MSEILRSVCPERVMSGMLKVIIADDEERVCRLVQMIVDWDTLGMEVIGTAANGLEALELLEDLKPDILITDIRMPGCDGLELIEKARAVLPHLQIALISGYAQFEYAQTAMKYDVGGYILKPIKKDIITATLEKLGSACRERAEMETESERLLQDSHKNSKLLKNRLLEDLLSRRITEPSVELLEREYGFIATDGLLQVVIVKIDCPFSLSRDPSITVIKKKAQELYESTIAPLCENSVYQMNFSAGYGLLCFKAENQILIRRALREYLNQLQAHRYGGVEISLAISKAVGSADLLPASVLETQAAIAKRIVEGTGRLLEAGKTDIQNDARKLIDKYNKAAQRVADMLSVEEADNIVEELSNEIKSEGLCGFIIIETVLAAAREFTERLYMDNDTPGLQEFEEICELCGSVGRLLDCLRDYLKTQIGEMKNRLENESIRPIRIAKNYIMQHFDEQITLEDVSQAVGFSVSYFSKMFKKETGEGFSRFLTRVRIDRAKELLRDTNLSVVEVCLLVGYSDTKHFTGMFNKMTSLTPGQYRKLYG